MNSALNSEQRTLVEEHMGLARAAVCAVVRSNPGAYRWVEEDMHQSAFAGLVSAALNFRPEVGTFSTYAYRCCWRAATETATEYYRVASGQRSSGARGELPDELGEADPGEFAPDAKPLADRVRGAIVARLEERMSPRVASQAADVFLRHRFGEEERKVFTEELGLSRERVRQLLIAAEGAFEAWSAEVRAEAA